MTCRNPACRDGRVPGVVAGGRGSTKAPLVGATMRWGLVNCRACSRGEKDPEYKHVEWTAEQVAERWKLAEARAEYKAEPVTTPLARIRLATPGPPVLGDRAFPSPPDNSRLDKLLDQIAKQGEQISKLTDQVSQLLEENRGLRAAAEAEPIKKPGVKKAVAKKVRPS